MWFYCVYQFPRFQWLPTCPYFCNQETGKNWKNAVNFESTMSTNSNTPVGVFVKRSVLPRFWDNLSSAPGDRREPGKTLGKAWKQYNPKSLKNQEATRTIPLSQEPSKKGWERYKEGLANRQKCAVKPWKEKLLFRRGAYWIHVGDSAGNAAFADSKNGENAQRTCKTIRPGLHPYLNADTFLTFFKQSFLYSLSADYPFGVPQSTLDEY